MFFNEGMTMEIVVYCILMVSIILMCLHEHLYPYFNAFVDAVKVWCDSARNSIRNSLVIAFKKVFRLKGKEFESYFNSQVDVGAGIYNKDAKYGWIRYDPTDQIPTKAWVQVVYRSGAGYVGLASDIDWTRVDLYRFLGNDKSAV